MLSIFHFFVALLVIYVAFNVFYLCFYAICSLFGSNKLAPENLIKNKIGVMIIAYKNDHVILESIEENLKQTYPKDRYDLIVVGDHLQPETVAKLNAMPIKVIAFDLPYSTKGNSVKRTEEMIRESDYDYIVMLDIDNVMEVDFLNKLNNELTDNVIIVQTHRTAKNFDTHIAILDAFSEEINNSIFRKGHVAIGLQTALIGSGIAMTKSFFLNDVLTIKAVGGYDKEMELIMALNKVKTKYTPDIDVYDEKTRYIDDFNKQRTRWFAAQFFYLRTNLFKSFLSLFTNSNVNYFNKTLQLMLMPKVLVLGFSFILPFITYFFYNELFPFSITTFIAVLVAAVLGLPKRYYKREYFSALTRLPIVFLTLLKSLAKIKGANRSFIATPHHTKDSK